MTKPLWISPTDLETTDLCHRKYWFIKVAKAPQVIKGSAAFGTALHGVVERYLRADDLGRNPDGDPVNLFPPGWHIVTERDGQSYTLSPAEQELVTKLVDKAIEEGHLVREPGRKIEHKWRLDAPGYDSTIVLNGKIDVLAGTSVVDHKTTKWMKYAKSANDLKKSIQMNLYGLVAVDEMAKVGEPRPDEITFAHKVYCKDPDDLRVRTTTAVQSVAAITQFYNSTVRPLIDRIMAVQKVEKWHEIDPPKNMAQACNAFGGCTFASICTGREKLEDYSKRLLNSPKAKVDSSVLKPPSNQTGTQNMGMLDRMLNKGAAPPVAAGAPTVNTPSPAPVPVAKPLPSAPRTGISPPKAMPAPVAKTPAPAEPAPTTPAPPWAYPGCGACGTSPHPGWNTAGAPCRICDGMSQQCGGPQSTWFVLLGQGATAIWEPKPEFAARLSGGSGPLPGTGAAVRAEVKEPTPEPVEAPKAPAAPDPLAEPEAIEIETKRKPGRPKVGVTLLIGCVQVRHVDPKMKVLHFDRLFEDYSSQLAEKAGMASYYDLDPFRRRDELSKAAEAIVDSLGLCTVQVSSASLGSPDHKAFLSAFRTFAGTVYEGSV